MNQLEQQFLVSLFFNERETLRDTQAVRVVLRVATGVVLVAIAGLAALALTDPARGQLAAQPQLSARVQAEATQAAANGYPYETLEASAR